MINVLWFNVINQFAGRNVLVDKVMILFAKYLIVILPLYLLYILLTSFNIKRFKISNAKKFKNFVFMFLSLILVLLLDWLISLVYYHPRPFAIGLGRQLINHGMDASFPSDHAAVLFATAFSLLFLKQKKRSIAFFIIGIIVGIARIFCGIHFPFDVIGSIAFGFVAAFLSFVIIRQRRGRLKKKRKV